MTVFNCLSFPWPFYILCTVSLINDLLISNFCYNITGRSGRRFRKQQLRYPRQYKRSYDPYDSHNEDECSHCDKHLPGEHSDCCPRYIDASQANDKIGSDDEYEMGDI